MTQDQLLLLADVVLAVHFVIAGYISLSLPVIWIGKFAGWKFVRNPWFRFSHAGLMGFVLFESFAGIFCPLTAWEASLRQAAGQGGAGQGESFIGYWLGRILFCDFDEVYFTVTYGLFFVVITLTLWLVPIRRKSR